MDARHFDQLTRSMAATTSRRGLLKGALAAIGAITLGRDTRSGIGWAAPDTDSTALWSYQGSDTIQYFALGDSVASGHGLMAGEGHCAQSAESYPYLLATNLRNNGISVQFSPANHIACSGSTTSDLNSQINDVSNKLRTQYPFPPTLVTITSGANDFDWLGVEFLTMLTQPSEQLFDLWVASKSEGIRTRLHNAVDRLLRMDEQISVLLTHYYNPMTVDATPPSVFFDTFGIQIAGAAIQLYRRIAKVVDALNGAITGSLAGLDPTRAKVVNTIEAAFADHPSACQIFRDPSQSTWTQSIFSTQGSNSLVSVFESSWWIDSRLLHGIGDCFHPNADGAKAIAREITPFAMGMLGPSPTSSTTNGMSSGNPGSSTQCSGLVCSGQCLDPSSNPSNCGQCGRECPSGECQNGRCVGAATCREPLELCGLSCRNLQSNPLHCGSCGNDCGGNACIDGVCQDAPTGCGTSLSICAGACVNITSDSANCGECGHVCSNSSCVQGDCLADFVCAVDSDCPAGSCCGNECVDLLSDTTSCGACGTICAEDQVCETGNCAYPSEGSKGTLIIETYDANTGQPVLGARYFVYVPGTLGYGMTDADSSGHSTGGLVDGVTDGLTIIDDMDPGIYSVGFMGSWLHPANQYQQSDYADFAAIHWDAVEINAGETAHLAVHLPGPSSAIEVHWVDGDGNPVPEQYCNTDGPGLWAGIGPVDDTNIWGVSAGSGYGWTFPLTSTSPCVFHLGPFGAGEVSLSFYDWSTGSAALIHSDNVTLNFGVITSVDAVVPDYCSPGRACSLDAECCLRLDEVCDEGICTQPVNVSSSPEPCLDGLVSCDGACTDLSKSTPHCGSCGNSCQDGHECQEGVCSEQESELSTNEENPLIEESPIATPPSENAVEIAIEPTATPADAVDAPTETPEPDVEPNATPLS